MNVFAYGSLMFPEVIYNVLPSKRTVDSKNAILSGYKRKKIAKRQYPGIIKCENASVKGVLYLNLTQREINQLNYFEGYEYESKKVCVTTQDNQQKEALVYVFQEPNRLLQQDWSPEEFSQKHKHEFAKNRFDSKP